MGVSQSLSREDLKGWSMKLCNVMEKYQDENPEGFDKMLWGDLLIMFNQGDTADFWDEQLNWKIISWKLHSFLEVAWKNLTILDDDDFAIDHEEAERVWNSQIVEYPRAIILYLSKEFQILSFIWESDILIFSNNVYLMASLNKRP
ncbi:hypothetical protein Tco_1502906 [Tanacetum coccineum]